MNYSRDLSSIVNFIPESSCDSYHLLQIWTDYLYSSKKQNELDLLVRISNNLNTRNSTLHSLPLNDLVFELKHVRELLLSGFIDNHESKTIDTLPSSNAVAFVVRNMLSINDPEVQLSLGIIINSPLPQRFKIFVLGQISNDIKELICLQSGKDIEFIILSKIYGHHKENITNESMKRLVAIRRTLTQSHYGYFVFLTDVSAKIGITSLLAQLLHIRAVICYHSPISSGLDKAKWLFFGNTSQNLPQYCISELIEKPVVVSNCNLAYHLPPVDSIPLNIKNLLTSDRLNRRPFIFCCANYWKLIADELLILNDVLSNHPEANLVLAPFPPHYQSRQLEEFYDRIRKYISPRNLSRIIIFNQPLGYEGVTWLVQNSILVIGTLLYPCISSMPICIKYNKTFIGGIHNTIRGMLCLQLESTTNATKIFLVGSHKEYISTVNSQLGLASN